MENTLLDSPSSQVQWIRSTFIEQTSRLVKDGYVTIAYMVMAQGIETMGAFMDKKPFKARGQGALRFDAALRELFPAKYSALNNRDFLYSHLRGNLTHLSVGSPHISLSTRAEGKRHLWVEDKCTSLVLEDFYEDFIRAWEEVMTRLTDGRLRAKPLVKGM